MYVGSCVRPCTMTATRRALARARPTITGGAARCGFRRPSRGCRSARAGRSRCAGPPSAAGCTCACRARPRARRSMKPCWRRVGELEQRAARRAQVDGEEVAAVLDVGDVGVAEADDAVLDARPGSRGCRRRTRGGGSCPRRTPRPLREVGLLDELEHAGRRPSLGADPVLVVRALGGDVLGAERRAQEVVHRLGLAHRGGGAVGAADRVLERDVAAVRRARGRRSRSRPRSSTGCRTDGRSRAAGCRSARSPRPRRPPPRSRSAQ